MTRTIERQYYEQIDVWKGYESDSALEMSRAQEVIRLLPNEVKSILDIGCGSGIITNSINKPFVVGLDFARTPLSLLKTHAIQGSIDSLPIGSKQFDLIMITEVLEHLDDEAYNKAIKEIKRLDAEYLMIAVPFDENLDDALGKCSGCGNTFHLYHHYRKFDDVWFNKEFREYKLERIKFSSYFVPSSQKLRKMKHKLGFYAYTSVAVCNKCGNRPIYPNRITLYVFGGLSLFDHYMKRLLKIQKPYHQILLLRRGRKAEES